VKIVINVVL